LLAELDAMMGLMDKDGDGNIDYQEFVRVGQMKTELNDMQAKAQSDNQALAQELTNIAQEKCEAQISQLRQLLEDKTTRLSGTDQVRARERVREMKGQSSRHHHAVFYSRKFSDRVLFILGTFVGCAAAAVCAVLVCGISRRYSCGWMSWTARTLRCQRRLSQSRSTPDPTRPTE
jgi:hypothetical protein